MHKHKFDGKKKGEFFVLQGKNKTLDIYTLEMKRKKKFEEKKWIQQKLCYLF